MTVSLFIEWLDVNVAEGASLTVTKFPITVAQYSLFLAAHGYMRPHLWSRQGWEWRTSNNISKPAYWAIDGYEAASLPVTGISFWEAEAFANFSGAFLPTSAEWSLIASNGGSTNYPWGDIADGERANLSFFGRLRPSGLTPVDAFPQGCSSSGIWDLVGNVSEWSVPNPRATEHGFGLLRGGCSWHTPTIANSYFSDEVALGTRDNQTGIRLIRRHGDPIVETESVERSNLAQIEDVAGGPITKSRPTKPFRQEGIAEFSYSSWKLALPGGHSLSLGDLRERFARHDVESVFACVCRWADINRFSGVLLADVIDAFFTDAHFQTPYLLQRSLPGPKGLVYESCVPLQEAIEHKALLCYEMDSTPLTPDLGAPLRYIDPFLYGYKQVKSLGELRLLTDPVVGWWERECQYDPAGIIRPGKFTLVGQTPRRMIVKASGRVRLK